MNIHKVILHGQDSDGKVVLSQRMLNLNEHLPIERYVHKLFRGILKSIAASEIRLQEQSILKPYINTQLSFMETSFELGAQWFKTFPFEGQRSLLIALGEVDTEMILMVAELSHKDGFVRITHHEHDLEHKLVYNEAILPDTLASLRHGFCLTLTEGKVMGKSKYLDLLADFVGGEIIPNTKASYGIVHGLVREISEQRAEDITQNVMKTKRQFQDLMEYDDAMPVPDFVGGVLNGLNDAETQIVHERMDEHHLDKPLDLKAMKRVASIRNHRVRTEKGIEVVLPLSELAVEDMLEIKQENGTVSIIIKDVGKIL